TPITPNQVTIFTLVLALAATALFAVGDKTAANWAAGLFILARFMDHFDGELARMTGKASRLGYYLDYVAGGLSYGGLFLGIGIGVRESFLGEWAIILGLAAAGSAVISMFLNLHIDKQNQLKEGKTVGYPRFAGFELEDGIYLIGPITWAGFLTPFFALSVAGAVIYTLWTLATVLRGK
ncbi:MAG: CDP-alcohol phosphatidyltransferase family protein, partial [Alphaproteobacteria bacterium]|nr:CDP-alcohol phosphatidyltransferase family protein [Alphaproteobacteria bacterium]